MKKTLSLDAPREIRTRFIHTFGAWWQNWSVLDKYLQDSSDSGFRSALCVALGLLDPKSIPTSDRQTLVVTLRTLYREAVDGGTHSAADWTLRRWHEAEPELPRTTRAEAGRQWFVNPSGVTMIRVPDGEYAPGITMVRGFYMSDREVPVSLWQQFLDDPNTDESNKPEDWRNWRPQATKEQRESRPELWGPAAHEAFSPRVPIDKISAVDAILFCNWLSRREHRNPCYTSRTRPWMVTGSGGGLTEAPGWNCDFENNGYRLPTLWEWRYAASVKSFPHHFGQGISSTSLIKLYTEFTGSFPASFESDSSLLHRYAWFDQNSDSHSHSGAEKMPSPWGLFDTFGNVNELCWDRKIPDGSFSICGGDWTGSNSYCSLQTMYWTSPLGRHARDGFRVACSDPDGTAAFEQRLAARARQVQENPDNQGLADGLAMTYVELGDHARDADDRDTAMQWYDKAADVCHRLLRGKRPYFDGGQRVNELFHKRAVLNQRWGHLEQALADWLIALDCDRKNPTKTRDTVLAVAMQVAAAGHDQPAFQAVGVVTKLTPKITDPEQLFLAARVVAQCARQREAGGADSPAAEKLSEYRAAARKLLEQATAAGMQDPERADADPLFQTWLKK